METDPAGLDFDLDQALESLVALRTVVPEDALTASVLGTERSGHGVVIDDAGTVLTIGYLVTEAESVWLTDHLGRTSPAYVLGYDQETGFGLVQALQPLAVPPLPRGRASAIGVGEPVVVAGHGGRGQAVVAQLIARREFAGYWEYVLDEALFTAPAHPNWGGAALLDARGRLCGIGSLLVQTVAEDGETAGANMVVPVDLLEPVLEDLRTFGRPNRPARPWLGWLVQEMDGELVVAGLYDECPATLAGVRLGDRVLEVAGVPVGDLAGLFRAVWALGPAGVVVPLTVAGDGGRREVRVESIDRSSRLKTGAVH